MALLLFQDDDAAATAMSVVPVDAEACATSTSAAAAAAAHEEGSAMLVDGGEQRLRHRSAGRPGHGHQTRLYYASQLMHPDWLTDIPADLGPNWLVLPRPEGPRCLVIASRGRTTSRLRNGVVLHRCAKYFGTRLLPSHLPSVFGISITRQIPMSDQRPQHCTHVRRQR